MQTRLITVIAVSTMMIASAAHADWGYTHWGMTPKQVVVASKGQAMLKSKQKTKYGLMTELDARQNINGAAVIVRFQFEDNKLTHVEGDASTHDCTRLEGEFKSKYGKSNNNEPSEPYSRTWDVAGDDLILQEIAGQCRFEITDQSNE